jgi:hypothetical protein
VTDSIVTRNASHGVTAFGPAGDPVSLGLERVTATLNGVGLEALANDGKITASNCTIQYNNFGLVTTLAAQLVSRGNNTLTDNTNNGGFTSTILPAYKAR